MFVSLSGHLMLGSDVATGVELCELDEIGVKLNDVLLGSLEDWLPVTLEAVKAS